MEIIGNIIKKTIEIKDLLTPEANPIAEQEEVLKQLISTAKSTVFGNTHQFEKMLKSDNLEAAFKKEVPYVDYHQLKDQWWQKTIDGAADITWPGTPNYFALSSGTTGKKSKRIPVTDDMIEAIKKSGIKQVEALANFDLPPAFFEKGILMLGSSTNLTERNGHLEGEISGISASNIPSWFRSFYKPGEEIAEIDDWDTRVEKIAQEAPNWDIGALSGIPSWIELMLEKVIETHQLNNIHEIWPNLEVYTSGGVAFSPYEKSFNKLLGRPIQIIDTYLASEGFIAFQQRPETDAMKLVTDNGIYFEFIPFEPAYLNEDGSLKQGAPSFNISEVKPDTDYVLVVSTVSGAWRYMIGDTIAFTDIERAEIVITGRTKFFMNVVGSQLSIQKMNDALKEIEAAYEMAIPEFVLSAVRINGEFYHHWYLGTDANVDTLDLAIKLDHNLQKANKNYRVARSKALKGVKVSLVPPSMFAEWNGAQKKKGGQVKMERVMSEEKFAAWESFVADQKVTFIHRP